MRWSSHVLGRSLGLSTILTIITSLTFASAILPAGADQEGPTAAQLAAQADTDGPMKVLAEIVAPGHGADVAATAEANGGTDIRTFEYIPYLTLTATGDAIRALDQHRSVVRIWEDVPRPPSLASTLPVINADDTQALGWTGAGRTVAILDTGIDDDHPFFDDNNGGGGSRILAEACFSDANDDDGDPDEDSLCPNGNTTDTDANVVGVFNCGAAVSNCDHGTHVAGIAAGDGTGVAGAPGNGVAPDANIIAVQVFTRFNTAAACMPNASPCILTWDSDQLAGLNWVAAQAVANPGWGITAVNMSLGGGQFNSACDGDSRKAAVDTLLAGGIATVISAGNNSFQNSVGSPGCISSAVTVGSTTDADGVSGFSNRGTLLDIFAPGSSVDSSIVNDAWGNKSGTSMAAPHVAGAFAVLREAYPTRTISQLLTDMQNTGVPITYAINNSGGTATTPRLDLLAALQAPNEPPVTSADTDPVVVDEGDLATNTGTFSDPEGDPVTLSASVGTVTDTGSGTWSWSWQTSDGPTPDSQIVTITATDDKDEDGTATFQLTVDNVDPQPVSIDLSPDTLDENSGPTDVTAVFTDPGWPDTYTASIDWGEGTVDNSPTIVVVAGGVGTPDTITVTGSHTYGDNGVYTVTVTLTDDDTGEGDIDGDVTVDNVDPTATIDASGAVLVNGVPTLFAHIGDTVPFAVNVTDPGSDDLRISWDWDDGAPAPDEFRDHLVNPPATDPAASPTVQPRDVDDTTSHVFGDACLYDVVASALDDDGGSDDDTISVVITGLADASRSSGYWHKRYSQPDKSGFTAATLQCYLDIVAHYSAVFNETRSAATFAQATDVMKTDGASDADQLLDAQLLAVWLNFANGAFDPAELVDTDGDGLVDTAFIDAVTTAEAVRNDPLASRASKLHQKDILERINLRDA